MMWKINAELKMVESVDLPSSKSQTIRALLFALLAKGESVIEHVLDSPDVTKMVEACRALGAEVTRSQTEIKVGGLGGRLSGASDVIDAGNSGLVYRFMTALGALSEVPIVITGDESIRTRRPIAPLLGALQQLGVQAFSLRKEGGAPVFVKGPMHPQPVVMPGEDSQPVSALLVAGAFGPGPFDLYIQNPGEKPWVALTLHWFDRLGIPYFVEEYSQSLPFTRYRLMGEAEIAGFSYTVPGDLSTLAFPVSAALITRSRAFIRNVDLDDPQGDKKLMTHLKTMGAKITHQPENRTLEVEAAGELQGIDVDLNDCIDALPILAVLGCFASGTTRITGAGMARHKESDRIGCMVSELKKMGALIEERPDGLEVRRCSLKGAHVDSHADHRVALSLAVAGLGASGETVIEGAQCSEKTYPNFNQLFSQ